MIKHENDIIRDSDPEVVEAILQLERARHRAGLRIELADLEAQAQDIADRILLIRTDLGLVAVNPLTVSSPETAPPWSPLDDLARALEEKAEQEKAKRKAPEAPLAPAKVTEHPRRHKDPERYSEASAVTLPPAPKPGVVNYARAKKANVSIALTGSLRELGPEGDGEGCELVYDPGDVENAYTDARSYAEDAISRGLAGTVSVLTLIDGQVNAVWHAVLPEAD